MQAFHTIDTVFDDPNLIGSAGLVPVMRLAEQAGLQQLLQERLSVASPNAAVKAGCVIAGMVAGADSIDDLDVLRHGAMGRVVTGVRAPSTVGTFLRTFTFGHVRQLDAVSSRVLARLTSVVPQLLAGTDAMAFVDIDDTIHEVHGYKKQGAAYGYSGVKGMNAQLAVLSSPTGAPVIAGSRLRKGNAVSGHGADRLIGDAVAAAGAAGARGQVMVRAGSCYYRRDVIAAVLAAKATFSVTVRKDPAVTRAISGIPEHAWTTIKVPPRRVGRGRAAVDLRSAGRRDHLHRVHLPGQEAAGHLPTRRAPGPTPQRHRDGSWSSRAVHQLAPPRVHHQLHPDHRRRRRSRLAPAREGPMGHLRTQLVTVPARVASSARRLTMHLPTKWHWASAWDNLWATATTP